jgi:hypothetical protein
MLGGGSRRRTELVVGKGRGRIRLKYFAKGAKTNGFNRNKLAYLKFQVRYRSTLGEAISERLSGLGMISSRHTVIIRTTVGRS